MNQHQFGNVRLILQRIQQLQLFWGKSVAWDQFRHTAKTPDHPKIVVLQSSPFVKNLLDRQFQGYAQVQNNSEGLQRLAEQVQLQSTQNIGALMIGFPNNSGDAEKLDRLLDGVNLAITFKISEKLAAKLNSKYLVCQSCGKAFNSALPFATPTHPGYENACQTPSKCSLEAGSAPDFGVNQEVSGYYAEKGNLLEYEIDEEHLYLTQHEFNEKLESTIAAHIKL